MRLYHAHPRAGQPRAGKMLAVFVLMLAALVGMVGLGVDGGIMLAAYRVTQNAADSASLAAAMELYRGHTQAAARTAAEQFVQQYNGLANATVVVNFGDDNLANSQISSAAAP